ncbi:MAG: hypothetical protein A3F09_03010 [Chlamydiae bacterium RIFCSPHIGHO2_12_FULL_49_11]|nr:MAG: hypothetical protein A3F09_03010 [Chlamydiae bacterium RIFCSPHIGHO2_12_FULL_49_11]
MYKSYLKNESDSQFHAISEPIVDSWIHCEGATLQDLKEISKIIRVDPEDLKDSLDMLEIARIERIENNAVVIYTRYPYMQEVGLYTTPLTIILAKESIVTICPISSTLMQRILNEPSKLATKMRSKFLIHILIRIIQEYNKVVKRVRAEVINQEKDISQVSDAEITELTKKEENLNQCLNSLLPLKKVIEEMLTGRFTILNEEDQESLEDLLHTTAQAEDLCRLSLRIITSLRNSVQIVITNQFNQTIRLLTALTIILNLPTTISSIYGMNISLPFSHSPYAFLFIIGFIVIMLIGAFFFFQRRRWL